MKIYDGNIHDISNNESTSYLQLNSCGMSNTVYEQVSFRKKGRIDYHILYVDEGECIVLYDKKEYKLKKGSFVFYPPFAEQKYKAFVGTKTLWLHFNGFSVSEIINEAKLSFGVSFSPHSSSLRQMIMQLITKFNQKSIIPDEKSLLLSLIYQFGKLQNNVSSIDEKLKNCISLITENPSLTLNINELAKMCNISESRFMHIFKDATGISPHAYQQSLRINNCKTVLLETNLKISDIAYQAGYDDPLYFSRIFKKITGVSPRQYRENNKLFYE